MPDGPPRQLLVYSFPPGTSYEGQLVGALERIESGGTLRILDAVFAGRDAETGEPVAVAMTGGTAGLVTRLISFRFDAGTRSQATRQALAGQSGALIRSLVEDLKPGDAVLAVLIEHSWRDVLDTAINRSNGTALSSDFTEHARIADAWPAT